MKSQREPEVEGTQQAGEHRCPHNSHRPPTARPSAFHEHNPLPTSCAPRVYGAMNSSISNDLLVCLHSPQHPLISLNQAEQGAHPSHSLTSTTLCFPAAEASFDPFPRGRTQSWSNTISTAHSALLTQHSRGERDFPFFPLPKLSSAFFYIKGEAN